MTGRRLKPKIWTMKPRTGPVADNRANVSRIFNAVALIAAAAVVDLAAATALEAAVDLIASVAAAAGSEADGNN